MSKSISDSSLEKGKKISDFSVEKGRNLLRDYAEQTGFEAKDSQLSPLDLQGILERIYEKKAPQLEPQEWLFINNNPLAMPPDNMYASFSHIYKALTKGSAQPLQCLVKIKNTPETMQNLNNEMYGGDENNDFKEKL